MMQHMFHRGYACGAPVVALVTITLLLHAVSACDSRQGDGKGAGDAAPDIDLTSANEFHKRCARLCKGRALQVRYDGPLALARGTNGLEPAENPADYACWSVVALEGKGGLATLVVRFRVSTQDSPRSIATGEVGALTLYVEVVEIAGDRGADDALPALGGRTVRQLFDAL